LKEPNFFIVGAPKCGTTALASWLGEHSNIFMSPIKEPHYFNVDFGNHNVSSYDEYMDLYSGANDCHKAIGEASVWYLYSKKAIPMIEKHYHNPKYIVMIRDPIKMTYSLHQQLVIADYERDTDFESAWNLSDERRLGKKIHSTCPEPLLLDYKTVGKLAAQIERLINAVGIERIHIIKQEELKNDPLGEYKKCLDFLSVDYDGREDFPVINAAKVFRSPFIAKATRFIGRRVMAYRVLRKSASKGYGILNKVFNNNLYNRERPGLKEKIKEKMYREFEDDQMQLLKILNDYHEFKSN